MPSSSECPIDPTARKEAVALYRGQVNISEIFGQLAPSGQRLEPGSEAALEADGRIKAAYYGVMGRIIDQVIDDTVAHSPLPITGIFARNTFTRLRLNTQACMLQGVDTVYESEASRDDVQLLNVMHAIRRSLRKPGSFYETPRQSLTGGVATATFWPSTLLRNMSPISRSLGHGGVDVVRNSYASLIEQASCNVYQLVLLQDAAEDNLLPELTYDEKLGRLSYVSPPLDLPLTDSMRGHLEATFGRRVACDTIREVRTKTPTIGCPILFKAKQVETYWNWTVDQAVHRNLL